MAGREIELSQRTILEALQSQAVRDALLDKAEDVRSAAMRIATSEEVDAEFTIEEGTRPKGRPYAQVLCDNVDQEWGTSKTGRRRILGRAGEEAR